MKKLSFIAFISSAILYACAGGIKTVEPTAPSGPETIIPMETDTAVATITLTATETATETAVPTRDVVITDIESQVFARGSFSEDFTPASIEMNILPSGGIETGADGRARIDLLPEGTIVRAGGSTLFNFREIGLEDGQAKTTIELVYGKLFILLNGGSLDVKTPLGVASVSDGLLRVVYDPQKDLFRASCLVGNCTLENQNNEIVTLNTGEFSLIEGVQTPLTPIRIYREEVFEWRDEIPELAYFLPVPPNPQDYALQNPSAPTPTKRPRSYP
jgi:hypothetical protein